MSERIKAIPTQRYGCHFRSKLEASFADWLEAHKIAWTHEVEGFDCSGVWYLPDFWLPDIRTFVEVKGVLDQESEQKVRCLAAAGADANFTVVLAEPPEWRLSLVGTDRYVPAKWRNGRFYPETTFGDLEKIAKEAEKKILEIEEEERLAKLPIKELTLYVGGQLHMTHEDEINNFLVANYSTVGFATRLMDTGVLKVKMLMDAKLLRQIKKFSAEYIQSTVDETLSRNLIQTPSLAAFCEELLTSSTSYVEQEEAAEAMLKEQEAKQKAEAEASFSNELTGFLDTKPLPSDRTTF